MGARLNNPNVKVQYQYTKMKLIKYQQSTTSVCSYSQAGHVENIVVFRLITGSDLQESQQNFTEFVSHTTDTSRILTVVPRSRPSKSF